jgi:hypothetical protein
LQEVELEKIKAIGSRNLLKSYTKQREAQQEQLRALIGILSHLQYRCTPSRGRPNRSSSELL